MAVILILTGGFNFLLNLSVLLYILVYVALTIGVYLMRKHEPDTPRPYRAFLYPWLGIVTLPGGAE